MPKRGLQDIFEKYKYDRTIAAKSKTWFQQQALILAKAKIQPNRLFREQKIASTIIPGKMYTFLYDPKYKDKLPYYDTFPLVLPYALTENGFIGLNLHYLPYYHRVFLLDKLMQFATNKAFDDNTKIRYSWNLINGVSKFRLANGCIKQYLGEHIQSAVLEIKPQDWHTAMMLPVEKFVGAPKNVVWGESLKK